MKLYLVQHADAVAKTIDPSRPLSPKGQLDAANMSTFLRLANVHVDEVVHSGKLRAEQTANAILPGVVAEQMDGLSPNDNTDHLILAAQAAKKDLMVVSHMPFVAKMAARCLTATEDGVTIAFKPGSVVCLEYIEGRWSLNWMMRP